jgi:hypothetical protein
LNRCPKHSPTHFLLCVLGEDRNPKSGRLPAWCYYPTLASNLGASRQPQLPLASTTTSERTLTHLYTNPAPPPTEFRIESHEIECNLNPTICEDVFQSFCQAISYPVPLRYSIPLPMPVFRTHKLWPHCRSSCASLPAGACKGVGTYEAVALDLPMINRLLSDLTRLASTAHFNSPVGSNLT